jgi:hypothetical protein
MMTLEDCRAFYSQEIRFAANLSTPGLVEAFAHVPRENFLGPPALADRLRRGPRTVRRGYGANVVSGPR